MFVVENGTSYILYSSLNKSNVESSGVDQLPYKETGHQGKERDGHMPTKCRRGLTGGESTAQADSAFSKEMQGLWEEQVFCRTRRAKKCLCVR